MIKNLFRCSLLCFLLAMQAHAGPILEAGKLIAAKDVLVDGKLYIVAFKDGSCFDLFLGCDDAEDFIFRTSDAGQRASQALIDQVFIDGPLGNFDSDPSLMRGCEWFVTCTIITPYEIRPPSPYGEFLGAAVASNNNGSPRASPDSTAYTSASIYDELLTNARTYAVWTPAEIPEPSSTLTMALLIASLAIIRRRRVYGNISNRKSIASSQERATI